MTATYLIFLFWALQAASVISQDCNVTLEAEYHAQQFQTPNYPEPYDNNLRCFWLLKTPDNGQVEVLFEDWETEPDYDYIEVRDGSTGDSPLLMTIQGVQETKNVKLVSSIGVLYVLFVTDRSVAERGFRAIYRRALKTEINITTVIQFTLADTKVACRVENRDNITREIVFEHLLPKNASVTSFDMTTHGVTFRGILEIKREAFVKYEEAFIRAITTPYVSGLKVSMKRFVTSIFVLPGKEAVFVLRYQELLPKTQSKYVYQATVQREQLFSNIRVDIYLCARDQIDLLRLPPIASATNELNSNSSQSIPPGYSVTKRRNFVHVSYRPPAVREVAPHGAQFELQYNLTKQLQAGTFYIQNGYYLHNFAPDLHQIHRRIVFVLDISGSMAGIKMEQVRKAVTNIIAAFDNNVLLNIVLFESVIRVWKAREGLVPANEENIRLALRFMNSLEPDGATNINDALMTGLSLLIQDTSVENRPMRSFIHPTTDYLIFLTDGKPTIGPRSSTVILRNVKRSNSQGYGIYSIGFGENVDVDFLQKLATQNGGTWKQIYEDADAGNQIQNFLSLIAAPLLVELSIKYPDDVVERSSTLDHYVLRKGEEILVAGVLPDNSTLQEGDVVTISVTGMSEAREKTVKYDLNVQNLTTCEQFEVFQRVPKIADRVYALLRLKELHEKLEAATTELERRKYRKEAIYLSMKYGFVTNVTALVIRADTGDVIASSTPPPEVSTTRGTTEAPRPGTKPPLPWIFQGDPHFIINLHDDVTVCFTWAGVPGKVYNLLLAPKHDISVNGLVVKAPARPPDEAKRVTCSNRVQESYFYSVALNFGKAKVALLLNPHNITIYNGTDGKRVKKSVIFSSDDALTLDGPAISLIIYDVSRLHSMVNVTLKGLVTFTINLHRTRDKLLLNHPKPMGDHVDMVVSGATRLSDASSGIFGEFLSRKMQRQSKRAHVFERKEKEFLKYRQRHVQVQHTEMVDPVTRGGMLGCYYICNATDFLRQDASVFEVPEMLANQFRVANTDIIDVT